MSELARSAHQIGAVIRRQRRKLGLSQSELGKKTDIRQATISGIESGNPATRIDTLLTLLGALDLEFRIAPRSRTMSRDEDIEDLLG